MGKSEFFAVAENIHCSLIRKTKGKFVSITEDGDAFIRYEENKPEKSFPVPEKYIETDDWKNGKVKHMSAAIWQGYYGEGEARNNAIGYIHYWAKLQEAYGASFLDINVDEFSTDIEEKAGVIGWTVKVVQEASLLPVSIDSSNFDILKAGLAACDSSKAKPMVNSVSLEKPEAIELAAREGAVVIAGATGREKMPDTALERVENCIELRKIIIESGLNDEDIFLDPLVFPVSVNKENGTTVIESIRELRRIFGEDTRFAPGLSNVSYGLPNRKLINTVFAHLCWLEGLNGGIVDPRHINLRLLNSMDTTSEAYNLARDLLLGKDDFGANYITASREGKI